MSFDVTSMVEMIDRVGNTFLEDRNQLFVLDTTDLVPLAGVDTIRRIEKISMIKRNGLSLS